MMLPILKMIAARSSETVVKWMCPSKIVVFGAELVGVLMAIQLCKFRNH